MQSKWDKVAGDGVMRSWLLLFENVKYWLRLSHFMIYIYALNTVENKIELILIFDSFCFIFNLTEYIAERSYFKFLHHWHESFVPRLHWNLGIRQCFNYQCEHLCEQQYCSPLWVQHYNSGLWLLENPVVFPLPTKCFVIPLPHPLLAALCSVSFVCSVNIKQHP